MNRVVPDNGWQGRLESDLGECLYPSRYVSYIPLGVENLRELFRTSSPLHPSGKECLVIIQNWKAQKRCAEEM